MAANPPPPGDKVLLIPHHSPSSDDLHAMAERYKKLRLHGLQANPEAFTSTYERESAFPPEEWIARMQNPGGKTFVAVMDDNDNPSRNDGITLPVADDQPDTNRPLLLEKEWMGLLTLIGPERLSVQAGDETALAKPWEVFLNYESPKSADLAPLTGAHVAYILVGMFVSSQARQRGNGQRLLEAAVLAARQEARARGAATARIVINVDLDNGVAKRLYERMGFEVWDDALELDSQGRTKRELTMVNVVYLTESS